MSQSQASFVWTSRVVLVSPCPDNPAHIASEVKQQKAGMKGGGEVLGTGISFRRIALSPFAAVDAPLRFAPDPWNHDDFVFFPGTSVIPPTLVHIRLLQAAFPSPSFACCHEKDECPKKGGGGDVCHRLLPPHARLPRRPNLQGPNRAERRLSIIRPSSVGRAQSLFARFGQGRSWLIRDRRWNQAVRRRANMRIAP